MSAGMVWPILVCYQSYCKNTCMQDFSMLSKIGFTAVIYVIVMKALD